MTLIAAALASGPTPARALGVELEPGARAAVVDRAGVIDAAIEANIAGQIATHRAATGVALKVLVVRSTGDEPMRAFALAAARAWGAKRTQRRVLCVLAVDDRRVRLEVSDALREGQLPDARAAQIIDSIKPHLERRRYGAAVALLVQLLRRDTTPDDRRLAALLQLLIGLACGFGLPLLAKLVDGPPRPWGPSKAVLAAYPPQFRDKFLAIWYGSEEKAQAAAKLHARGPRRSPWIYGIGLPLLIGGFVLASRLADRPSLLLLGSAGVLHGFALGMALLRSTKPLRPIVSSAVITGGTIALLLSLGPRPIRDHGDVLLLALLGALVLWPIAAYASLKGMRGARGYRGGGRGGHHGGGYGGSSSSSDSGFSGGGAGGSW